MIKTTLIIALIFCSYAAVGQSDTEVIVPKFNDKYCDFVKNLEAGKTDINYRAFRESFIESEQFKIASGKGNVLDSLKKETMSQIQDKNYPLIILLTKKMLSIDYTNMWAHKILRQTYRIQGDTVNRNKYHDIEFGLLYSILKNGDGKTCETAWPVIQISEEYFILDMIGAKLLSQTLDNKDGLCDKMDVKTDEGKKTYYFEVSKVFEGYHKLGLK